MKDLKIYTKKTGAGHYEVEVVENMFCKNEKTTTFETTDMQLIDDIHEMNDDGFEQELVMHETFEEVKENVLRLARI